MRKPENKHSLARKIFFRTGVYAQYILGAYAIFLDNKIFAIFYIVFASLSLRFCANRFCSHCPKLCNHHDCLMLPYPMINQTTRSDPGTMGPFDRMTFPLIMVAVLPLLPQYWLFKHPTLFIIFWILYIVVWPALLLFECRQYTFQQCPFNLTKRLTSL